MTTSAVVLAVALGLVVGLLIGALGGGGAILTVPVLVYVFGQSAHSATTSSLIIVGVSSLVGLLTHQRQGNVRWGQGALFGVIGVGGAYLGAQASRGVKQELLLTLFAGLLIVVATLMARKALRARRNSQKAPAARGPASTPESAESAIEPEHPVPPRESGGNLRRWVTVALTATGVGLLTGFFGVGGGFAIVPALTLVLGFSMSAAVGTSLLVIAINSGFSFLFHSPSAAALNWGIIAPMLVASIVGALAGGRLTRNVPQYVIQLCFAAFLVGIAVYMGARSVPALV